MRSLALIAAAAVGFLATGLAAAGLARGDVPVALVAPLAVLGVACLVVVWSDRLRAPRLAETVAHVLAALAAGAAASQALGLSGIAETAAQGAGLVATWCLLDRRWWGRGGPAPAA